LRLDHILEAAWNLLQEGNNIINTDHLGVQKEQFWTREKWRLTILSGEGQWYL
jgi:hypothetical protein